MRRLRVAGLSFVFLSLAMLVVSAQAGTAKPQSGKVKGTARPVLALAMDGPRVVDMRTDGRVGVWNVVTARARLKFARVSQKAVGVSLPRDLDFNGAGDVRPQVACPSVSGCVTTWGTASLLVLREHRGKWTREATLAGVGVRALDCPSLGSCSGTGWISGNPKALVTQSGRSWHASAVQLPTGSSPSSVVLPSVSCGSAGDCVAVGWNEVFNPGNLEYDPLLVEEQHGVWGSGFEAQLPADAATAPNELGVGGIASVVSCPSAGNCAVAGTYTDMVAESSGPVYRSEGWVATEQAGHWRPGVTVQLPPDADTIGTGIQMSGTSPFIGFTGMSCPSAGNCTAVGGYEGVGGEHGLILTERRGVWLRGIRAPGGFEAGTANSWIDPLGPVSCADPSDCAAVASDGWLLTKRHGKWNAAKLVLPRKTKAPGGVFLNQVSCPSRGNCVAIGFYASHGRTNGIIDIERRGKWERAIRASLPKDAAKATKQHGGLNAVSCPSTNRCTIVGTYSNRHGKYRGLILNLGIR